MKKILSMLALVSFLTLGCEIDEEKARKQLKKVEKEEEQVIRERLTPFFYKDKVTIILLRHGDSVKYVLQVADELGYELKFFSDSGSDKLVYIFYKKEVKNEN